MNNLLKNKLFANIFEEQTPILQLKGLLYIRFGFSFFFQSFGGLVIIDVMSGVKTPPLRLRSHRTIYCVIHRNLMMNHNTRKSSCAKRKSFPFVFDGTRERNQNMNRVKVSLRVPRISTCLPLKILERGLCVFGHDFHARISCDRAIVNVVAA